MQSDKRSAAELALQLRRTRARLAATPPSLERAQLTLRLTTLERAFAREAARLAAIRPARRSAVEARRELIRGAHVDARA